MSRSNFAADGTGFALPEGMDEPSRVSMRPDVAPYHGDDIEDSQRVRVNRLMRRAPLEVGRLMRALRVGELMRDARAGHAVVVRDPRAEAVLTNVMGVLSEEEVQRILHLHPEPESLTASDLLHGTVVSIAANCSLQEAMQLSVANQSPVFVVVDGPEVVGLLTDKDLLEATQGRLSGLHHFTEQLRDEARHDALTGLANRRYFDLQLEQKAAIHQETGQGIGMLMLDIDHFKSINDTYGHEGGDVVLRELARRLRNEVRSSDLVARIGGEEFAILASVPHREALFNLGEKVRRCIAGKKFRAPVGPPQSAVTSLGHEHEAWLELDVTVSVGAALLEGKLDSPRRLVRAADDGLYTSKREGRNRVSWGRYRRSTMLPAVRSR